MELTGTVNRDYQVPVGTSVTISGSVVDDAGAAVDITGATVTVRWKTTAEDADVDAVATATGTVTNGPGGLYEFTNPAASTVSSRTLRYHVEVDGADVYYPQKGRWTVYDR